MGVSRSLDIAHRDLRPAARVENWLQRTEGQPKETNVFGDDITWLVTRVIQRSVAERGFPSGRFPIHSLRAGGSSCLYHSGVSLDCIMGLGRWRSVALAIYLHFEENISRNSPPPLA